MDYEDVTRHPLDGDDEAEAVQRIGFDGAKMSAATTAAGGGSHARP